VLGLKLRVPREAPVIDTVTDRFPGAANYERELDDLLGFEVVGLPPGKRYPLPDDWPKDQKPLRKDWKPTTA
jgi:Ni,Fe-hydrogenase III component G